MKGERLYGQKTWVISKLAAAPQLNIWDMAIIKNVVVAQV